jgi:hypothetical protein
MTAEEYHKRAAAALEAASLATDPDMKAIHESQARDWLKLATLADEQAKLTHHEGLDDPEGWVGG